MMERAMMRPKVPQIPLVRWLQGSLVMPRWSLLLLRFGLGGLLLWSGLDKALNPEGWTAAGFLTHATSGPLAGIFQGMAGSAVVDGLVIWGEVLIGLALILGAAVRWAALAGSVMLLLFYLAQLPPEHGWISDKLLYIVGLNLLAAARAGTFLGVDGLVERVEQKAPALRYLLG